MKRFCYSVFIAIAALAFLSSCSEESAVNITVSADKESIVADGMEIITFTVTTDEGVDVTSESVIKVNSVQILGHTFSTSEVADYKCVAEYKSSQSAPINFTVKEAAIFIKNTLVENYTAVWCGYCPRVHDAIKDALEQDDRVIAVAIHGSDDPYYFTSIGTLASKYGISGYPTAMIDRSYSWPYPETFSGLANALDMNAALGLSIETEISGNNINADVNVKFGKDFNTGLKLVVCLVESGLIHDQVNYYDDGRGDPIPNYVHNNVLRIFGTDLLGDEIPEADIYKDNVYTKSISFNASDYIKENCKVVAFVVSEYGRTLNTQQVNAGSNKTFEMIVK